MLVIEPYWNVKDETIELSYLVTIVGNRAILECKGSFYDVSVIFNYVGNRAILECKEFFGTRFAIRY